MTALGFYYEAGFRDAFRGAPAWNGYWEYPEAMSAYDNGYHAAIGYIVEEWNRIDAKDRKLNEN